MPQTTQWSRIVPNTATRNRGPIHRSHDRERGPSLHYHGCRTLYEAFRRGQSLNPMKPFLGYRQVGPEGKAGPFVYLTYTEVLARVDAFAAGVDVLNLVLPTDDNKTLIGLYMKNCMEWFIAEHAIFALSGATVPLYDTLGPESAEYILNQTGTKTVVCTRAELSNICRVKMNGNCPALNTVVLVDGVAPEATAMAEKAGLDLVSFAKVEAVGAELISTKGHKHRPPSGDDIFTFCYTSGTTGNPKGALLSHSNIISAISGGETMFNITAADRHLSYLPLAHIFERTMMCRCYAAGASIGFYRGNPLLLIEDLRACRPTLFAAAPRVLNRIYHKIHADVEAEGGMKKKLFDLAVATKVRNLLDTGTLKHSIYDRLIFDKIKVGLGLDNTRFILSGSAPLSKKVMMFYRVMMGVPVVEGYAQTEGSGSGSAASLEDMMTVGHVGVPNAVAEIALADVPEMGYLHSDVNHGGQPCQGRGEIWIRGPHVFLGYYKDPEKTKEVLEHGWLKTGDIGLWTMQGQLQIIDRKKNIFKLSQGEYVAPEKIENILTQSTLVAQAFVYGDSLESKLVAVLIPDEQTVRQVLKKSGYTKLSMQPLSDLCKSEVVRKTIEEDIKVAAEAGGLNGFEIPKAFLLDSEMFSVGNGILTPSMKLKRYEAKEKYLKAIELMYTQLNKPLSSL